MGRSVNNKKKPIRDFGQELELDEIDEVVEKRSKGLSILHQQIDNSSQDDSEVEEILGLDITDSASDEDNDEEDFEDEDEEENDRDERISSWGKNKHVFYSKDKTNDEDRIETEKEMRQLRSQQLKEMTVEDFAGNDDSFASLLARHALETDVARPSAKLSNKSELFSYSEKGSNLGKEIESIKPDLQSLSKDEQWNILLKESPEFLQLLSDLRSNVVEVREFLSPLVQKFASTRTDKGMSLLEIKYQLLLSYCTNILFYLLLKAEGQSVRNHPVIDHLVKLRVILEKIKPLENKLKYQIDKLVKTTVAGSEVSDDPLQYKPQPGQLIPKHKEVNGGRFDENDDDQRENLEETLEDDINDRNDNGYYRIPKMTPVVYDGDNSRNIRSRDKRADKVARKRILSDLQAEFSLAPEEYDDSRISESANDNRYARQDERLSAIEKHEEDHFVRLPMSKKDKQRMKQRSRAHEQFEDVLDDLGEYASLLDQRHESGLGAAQGKKSKNQKSSEALTQAIGQLEEKQEKLSLLRNRSQRGDDDVPYKTRNFSQNSRHDGSVDDHTDNGAILNESNMDDDNDYYQEIKNAKRARKDERDKVHERVHKMVEETVDGKRHINRDIMKNKGLTAYHKKEFRNPRVKHRTKYDKAVKRLGNVKPKTSGSASGNYGGESTGIKSNISRSVRFT